MRSAGSSKATCPPLLRPAESLDQVALGGLDGRNGDGSVAVDLGLEPGGGGGRELGEHQSSDVRGRPGERVENVVVVHLTEDGLEVATVELGEVFEVHHVRQGWPPDR